MKVKVKVKGWHGSVWWLASDKLQGKRREWAILAREAGEGVGELCVVQTPGL